MKSCQNSKCQESIQRDSAIFCPYCGQYQETTGWHSHEDQNNRVIGQFSVLNVNTLNPTPLTLSCAVRDCFAEGNVLVVLTDEYIAAYDITFSLNRRQPHEIWRFQVRHAVKMVILRPYLVFLEGARVLSAHLETGDIRDLLNLDAEPSLTRFRDAQLIMPYDSRPGGNRTGTVILANEKCLLLLHWDARNQFQQYSLINIEFKGFILSMHFDDHERDTLIIYSVLGEKTRLNLRENGSVDSSEQSVGPIEDIYYESRPSGGFQVEWAFTKKEVTYFLERKTAGDTTLYKLQGKNPEIVSRQSLAKKSPSAGQSNPLILFELLDFKNQLMGYHLLQQSAEDYNLDTPIIFNIDRSEFEFHPDRLLFCHDKYWALCPCKKSAAPYQLVSLSFDQNGVVLVEPHKNIPIPSPNNKTHNEVLPLILNDEQLLSFVGNTIILLSKMSE